MSMFRMVVILLAPLLLSSCGAGRAVRTPAVEELDPSRYAGCWYEIASIPSAVQEGCVATIAEYRPNDDGSLSVRNSCRLRSFDGTTQRIRGRAWAPEASEPGKLKVQFDNWWGVFARGDYWILELDPGYDHALVGGSDPRRLWVLSRSPSMDEETYAELVESARDKGYEVEHLLPTPQDTDYVSCD